MRECLFVSMFVTSSLTNELLDRKSITISSSLTIKDGCQTTHTYVFAVTRPLCSSKSTCVAISVMPQSCRTQLVTNFLILSEATSYNNRNCRILYTDRTVLLLKRTPNWFTWVNFEQYILDKLDWKIRLLFHPIFFSDIPNKGSCDNIVK